MKNVFKIVLGVWLAFSSLQATDVDITQVGQFGGEIRDMMSVRDYTYTAQGNSLNIYNTLDEDNPTLFGSYDTNEKDNI